MEEPALSGPSNFGHQSRPIAVITLHYERGSSANDTKCLASAIVCTLPDLPRGKPRVSRGIAMARRLRFTLYIMTSIRYGLFVLVLLAGYPVRAQQAILPDAPSSHKFLDRHNAAAFTTLGGLIAVDAVTTQRLINSGQAREANPLWRPLVRQGWQGEMAASALGFGAAVGMAYTFHKTGHHKMERFATWLSAGVEASNDAHNLAFSASH